MRLNEIEKWEKVFALCIKKERNERNFHINTFAMLRLTTPCRLTLMESQHRGRWFM